MQLEKIRGLLFVPSEAIGEHLDLATSILRLHKDCERRISRFRFSIEEAGVIGSLPCLVQPWVLIAAIRRTLLRS
jgi:hypothetical protein